MVPLAKEEQVQTQ